MSGRLLLKGEDPALVHYCPTPPPMPGALWVCDCGQHWQPRTSLDFYGQRSWKRITERQARRIIKRAR